MQSPITRPANLGGQAIIETKSELLDLVDVANGPAAATFYAGGIGAALLGIFVVLAEMIPAFKTAMTLNKGVGPLSGKTIFPTLAFLLIWGGLSYALRGKNVNLKASIAIAFVGMAIGLLGTFPPVMEFFVGLTK
jgi:hypothetical protein